MDAIPMAASLLPENWTSLILMIFGFGMVILVHELGHFLVAKWVGIKVEEFAIGFGRKVVGIKKGETEYRINILPLGGYVKMLGQEDFALKEGEEDDPRAYNRRPIWARMCVVSAGVVMNVLLAAVLFMIVFSVGKEYSPAEIGTVAPASPADLVQLPNDLGRGLQSGDAIEEINGKPIKKFDKIRMTAMLSGKDETFLLTVRRPGVAEPFQVRVGTDVGVGPSGAQGHVIGVGQAIDRVLDDQEDSVDLLQQMTDGTFQGGDTIVSIDGAPIEHGWQIVRADDTLDAAPVEVVVERKDDETEAVSQHTATLVPMMRWSTEAVRSIRIKARNAGENPLEAKITPFNVLGLQPRMRVAATIPEGPAAEAGLRHGDIIATYGPNKEIPTLRRFNELCEKNEGKAVDITLLRDGAVVSDITSIQVRSHSGKAMVGIQSVYEQDRVTVAGVIENSPFAGVISPGATITAVNDVAIASWPEFIKVLADLPGESTVALTYETPAGGTVTTGAVAIEGFAFNAGHYAYSILDLPLKTLQREEKSSNPAQAMVWGVEETGDFIMITYATLRSFFSGRVSGKEFSGPIGIFRAGVRVGERGVVWLVWLLAIISANLAVINFLPLPIVDGGLMVFLVVEKIRRKPLSVAFQNAVQVIGLVAIAVVFVLLTYNDIVQWLRSTWH